jgi:hypothetical protein
MPLVTYGNIVYSDPDAVSKEKMERVFRACISYLHRLRRRDDVGELLTTVNGLKLHDYLKLRLLSFVFKILHILHPCYVFTMFHFSSSQRTRVLVPPVHRRLAMDQSFIVNAVYA